MHNLAKDPERLHTYQLALENRINAREHSEDPDIDIRWEETESAIKGAAEETIGTVKRSRKLTGLMKNVHKLWKRRTLQDKSC